MNFFRVFFVLIGFLFLGFEAFAQYYIPYRELDSKLSIEAGGGVLFPISPSTNNSKLFGDTGKLELGLRYKPFRNNFGLRASYSYSGIRDEIMANPPAPTNPPTPPTPTNPPIPTSFQGKLEVHKLELQALYMLDELLNISTRSDFEIESYIGLGMALAKGSRVGGNNKVVSSSIGIRPRYRLRTRLYFYLDTSYAVLINQKIAYSGQLIPNVKKNNIGGSMQVSIGLSYML